ncbi:MAG: cysteinyl-tRNA synthetase [Chaenotheca gracillima]|nr:MAG: cysteinyl-tRNA synthetase [Chaenotheca gracillima]
MFFKIFALVWVALLQMVLGQDDASSTYTNPVLDSVGADPWVIKNGDYYYLTYTTNDNITLSRSKTLTDWNDADSKLLFKPPMGMNYSTDLWAPELHNIDNKWYVIFTADPMADMPPPEIDMFCEFSCPAVNHRMYVLESNGSDPWESNFTMKGQLNTFDQFAIDGTYFQHSSGLYHIYSCWYRAYDGWPSNLCITKSRVNNFYPVSDPWTVTSNLTSRTILSTPSQPWEQTPYGRSYQPLRLSSNEGPEQLTNPKTNQTFVIYSAARSDNANYCLGQLELVGDDPMNVQDWRKRTDGCVFYQNALEGAYGVGHASFTTAGGADGDAENWIVYHGMRDPSLGWGDRTIRAQRFEWNADGSPKFPRPGYGPYSLPSGA